MEMSPTDRELEALKVLWRHGEATVRDIYERTNKGGGNLAYTTVLSLLQVMERKGLVCHRQSGKAYLYSAVVQRDSTFRKLAGGFLEKSLTAPWTSTSFMRSNRDHRATRSWTAWKK